MATRKITPEQKSAILEGLKVFAWAGLSAVIPLLIAQMQNDPRWAILIPFVNSIAYALNIEIKNRQA